MEAPGLTPPPFYQIALKCVNQWENIFLVRREQIMTIVPITLHPSIVECQNVFLGESHLSAFGCEVTHQWGIAEDLSDLKMGPRVSSYVLLLHKRTGKCFRRFD